jgi:hypothetical protein
VSTNFGGFRTSKMLIELVLQFAELRFCSSEKGKKILKKEKTRSPVDGLAL